MYTVYYPQKYINIAPPPPPPRGFTNLETKNIKILEKCTKFLQHLITKTIRTASHVLPSVVWELGFTYWSLLHSTMHFRIDTKHSNPFFLRLNS